MIHYYIHKTRTIVEKYEKWLSENDNAEDNLAKLLENRDAKLKKMVYRMISKRFGEIRESPIIILMDEE